MVTLIFDLFRKDVTVRVSGIITKGDSLLLIAHRKRGDVYWLLPGGGVNGGESLVEALRRELVEEVGVGEDLTFEGPIAVVDSIAPKRLFVGKHVVHIIFAADLSGRSLEKVKSTDLAVRGHRIFDANELDEVVLHPPLQRFLQRWEPGDPAVYLGALWAP